MKLYLPNLLLFIPPLLAFVLPRFVGAEAVLTKPVLLMLMTDGDTAKAAERFRNELALELETHTLLVKPGFLFSSDNLSGRIDEIRRVAASSRAEAVIWLEQKGDGTLSLQLVATAPGQSTVRSVEAGPDGDMEGELAVAARTLLKELHIAVVDHDRPRAGVSEAARRNRNVGPADTFPASGGESAPPAEKPNTRIVHPAFGVELFGDLQANPGPSVLLGGWIGVGFGRLSGVFGEISLSVFGTPIPDASGDTVRILGVRPGLGAGYLFGQKKTRIGPYLGVQVPWERASVAVDRDRRIEVDWWNLRFQPSLEIRIQVHRITLLVLRPGLGATLRQAAFERASDGTLVYASAYLEWHVAVGVWF